MFKCVDCYHESSLFKLKVTGQDRGSYTYKAICPSCGSEKVNALPGPHEKDIRIIDVISDVANRKQAS
ncbi:hypothetical protein ES703_77293 [subsurface metagenome]